MINGEAALQVKRDALGLQQKTPRDEFVCPTT